MPTLPPTQTVTATPRDPSDRGPFARLPQGFVIGAATSAFQVEGALDADGRGASIWDVPAGEAGGRSCNHYEHWSSDLALLGDLAPDAFRLSIAWPRVQPDGRGRPNQRALDHYSRVVERLREHDIAPVVCLYHWDLPQALQAGGGWHSRTTAERFGEYAAVMADRLGDAVELWVTLNEPFMHLLRGHIVGDHAPGLTLEDWSEVAHHLLVGHGCALAALRAAGVAGAVGLIENITPVRPISAQPGDAQAAFIFDLLYNQLMLGAVLQGSYPEMLLARRPTLAAIIQPGDMKAISAPLDVLGVNYYGPTGIQMPADGRMPPFEVADLPDVPVTGAGTAIDADGLRETLVTLHERYGAGLPPMLVTEFGRDAPDELDEQGRCEDHERIAFLEAHVAAIGDAVAQGVDVRGCFVWSFLDSFEWEHGLGNRYGLVHVDFETQERLLKRSALWYRDLIAQHRRDRAAIAE